MTNKISPGSRCFLLHHEGDRYFVYKEDCEHYREGYALLRNLGKDFSAFYYPRIKWRASSSPPRLVGGGCNMDTFVSILGEQSVLSQKTLRHEHSEEDEYRTIRTYYKRIDDLVILKACDFSFTQVFGWTGIACKGCGKALVRNQLAWQMHCPDCFAQHIIKQGHYIPSKPVKAIRNSLAGQCTCGAAKLRNYPHSEWCDIFRSE